MPAKQRLILHIGLHKTGTSFIQQMFARNLDRFAAAGVTPAGVFNADQGQHHKLLLLLKEGQDDAFFEVLGNGEGTILVTSEGFTSWISNNDDEKNSAFAARLRANFDVRVVVMLRRQDFLKESVFAEVASNHFFGPIEKVYPYFYDFDLLLSRLEAMFDQSNIGLGVYRDDRRGDLTRDFLDLAGINLAAADLNPVPPQRVSLHRRKVSMLSQVPKLPRANYRKVRAEVVASDVIIDDGIKFQMSPEARRDFLRQYHDSNRMFCRRYGLDSDTTAYMTSDVLDSRAWTPLPPMTDAERAFLLEAMARHGVDPDAPPRKLRGAG